MKTTMILLASLMFAASVAPAYAGYHCYVLNGRTICCNTVGNYSYCN